MLVQRPEDVHPEPVAPDKFTEGVWQEVLLDHQTPDGMRAHRFSYPPGGHSHWHAHEGEQALMAVTGFGWVKMEGEQGVAVHPGDLVYVPKLKKHWHGAQPRTLFVHLAFTASGSTSWEGEVTGEEYEAEF
jgi:quercetin dioxygenase-like cupin family protein